MIDHDLKDRVGRLEQRMNKFEELLELLSDDKVINKVDAAKKEKIKQLVKDLRDPFKRPVGSTGF
jgi:hypothetical protein